MILTPDNIGKAGLCFEVEHRAFCPMQAIYATLCPRLYPYSNVHYGSTTTPGGGRICNIDFTKYRNRRFRRVED
jgi:hypothetical protein